MVWPPHGRPLAVPAISLLVPLLSAAGCSRGSAADPAGLEGTSESAGGEEGVPYPGRYLDQLIDRQADAGDVNLYQWMLEDRRQTAGPWHENIHVAYSPDGTTIDLSRERILIEQAAVPEAVVGPDGRYYLFYGEGSLERGAAEALAGSDFFARHGVIGFGALMLAVSDDGVEFTVVPEFGVEGLVRGMVIDPEVIRLPDGRWRLYYIGLTVAELVGPDAWSEDARHRLYYAESDDLIHWTQVGMAVEGPFADPAIHCGAGGRCLLTCTGMDWGESTDGGQTFSFEERGEPFGFAPSFLELADGTLQLFYNSRISGGAVMSRSSSDGGATWTDDTMRVPDRVAEALSFAPAPGGGYLVYFHYWVEGIHGDTWQEHRGQRPRRLDDPPQRVGDPPPPPPPHPHPPPPPPPPSPAS